MKRFQPLRTVVAAVVVVLLLNAVLAGTMTGPGGVAGAIARANGEHAGQALSSRPFGIGFEDTAVVEIRVPDRAAGLAGALAVRCAREAATARATAITDVAGRTGHGFTCDPRSILIRVLFPQWAGKLAGPSPGDEQPASEAPRRLPPEGGPACEGSWCYGVH